MEQADHANNRQGASVMANKRQLPSLATSEAEAATLIVKPEEVRLEIIPTLPSQSESILQACRSGVLLHYQQYVESTVSALQNALAAGKFATVIKDTVGHGLFRTYCEREFPDIQFRRIGQFKQLAEREDELLEILRAQNAQHGAPLSDQELLASLSVRKAQRLLSRDVAERPPQRTTKCRKTGGSAVTDEHREQWLTPPAIVDATRQLLGGIELDPAAGNNPCLASVPRRIGPEEDGLTPLTPWSGAVFLHPPFKRISEWVSRCRSEFTSGTVREAVLLVPAVTDSPWFLSLAVFAKGFLRQRPQFSLPRRSTPQVADLPYVVVHLAHDDQRLARFAAAFGELADIHLPFSAR